jgi:RHS repeat-associated protein
MAPPATSQSRSDSEQKLAAPSISLPKGGGAIRGMGEKFAANPVTGTGSMSVPIATSPGRSGFGPQLSLSYDSGSGNGPFGFGWSLSIPTITRKTDRGLPEYRDAEESDVYILSGAEDLVPVLLPDGKPFKDDTSAPGYVIHRYRPRIEGLFARLERWTKVATGEVHWRSISRDNVTTLYGKDNNSRITDPDDPTPSNPTRSFSWLICESYDDKGNAIVYEYAEENADNVDFGQTNERNRARTANRYLKRIKYGNRVSRLIEPDLAQASWLFEVVFDYDEDHYKDVELDPTLPEAEQHRFVRASAAAGPSWSVRPDPFSSYRAGFEVRTYRRCRRVLMFHHFPDLPTGETGYDGLVRSTEFDYADLDYEQPVAVDDELTHQGSTRFASFIRRITQSGYLRDESQPLVDLDGVQYATYLKKSLPPLEFEYSTATIQDQLHELDAASLENLPAGLDALTYQWVDLDGEGVSGILTEQTDAWFYKPNLGDGRFGRLETVAAKPSLAGLSSGRQQLLDLAGDGQLDLVTLAGPTPGFFERTSAEDWEPFRAFREVPSIPWDDPNLRFVDLDGDGHADILITEQDVFTWHESLAEDGFGPARSVRQPLDEERGPRLVFADGTQSIYVADMCGDGLADLVRIRNGEVCYWPNLGYGRFGAKVTMDNAPQFDHPDQFDQRRVRLADIDGSGASDIVYLARNGACLYFNQSGNSWTELRRLAQSPRVDDLSSVTTTDLRGNGTACLVWSSPLPDDADQPVRYVDLMGTKPHLLVRSINNLGAETELQYAPSTRFYLADKREGRPWIARLPFPVHVVERFVTHDRISGNRFVTRYAYHHGYFDGVEREFRGFGMVEQWDTEEFAALDADGHPPAGTNIDASSHVPPVHTKTWFHVGMYLGRDHVSDFYAGLLDSRDTGEYYREPGVADAEARVLLLDDTVLPANLTIEEEREACRALKGSMLRQEVYAIDGTDKEPYPYSVTEQNVAVRALQHQRGNRHSVFLTHPLEAISYQYERKPADPRIGHALTLEVDEYGNVLRSAAIGYGRRHPDPSLTLEDQADQGRIIVTYTENRVTNAIESADDHHIPLPCESRTYELTGLTLAPGRSRFTFHDVDDAGANAATVDYEVSPTTGVVQKRLIEEVRTYYRRNDLGARLPLTQLESLGLPFETYKLALTPGLVTGVFGNRVDAQMLASDGRYVHTEEDANWWIPSGQAFLSPISDDTPQEELAYAREHFFLPHRYRDPFHSDTMSTESFVTYDAFDLLVKETRDALGNRVTVGERDLDPTSQLVSVRHDYRVLQPRLVMDPNRNRSEVVFDALGMVVGTAVMGKPEDEPVPGDRLSPSFRADLTQAEIDELIANPKAPSAAVLLGGASTRVIYDLTAYWREPEATRKPPAVGLVLARETHASEPVPPGGVRIQASLSYSDGFAREIQKKIQAEPGPVPVRDEAGRVVVGVDGQPLLTQSDASPRWVGSGWTVFNNKGKPVRQYEPFFSDRPDFEFDVRIGVSPVLLYDPVERVVATLRPDHSWEKVVFAAWRQETWDGNDTVGSADPATDPDVGEHFRRLLASDYLPTWHTLRTDPAHVLEAEQRWPDPLTRAAEESAAVKTSVHATTPTVAHSDSLGRTFLTIAHNRFEYSGAALVEEFHRTRITLDVEGNQREVSDAKGRVVMRYDYDVLGNRIHQASMEAGERWMLNDVASKTLSAWDSRGHRFRTTYDQLRRPIDSLLSESGNPEVVVGRTVYGESRPNPEASNLRGRVAELHDQAGIILSDEYDFKGNLLKSERRLAEDYTATLNWASTVPIEADALASRTRYDALNRPTVLTSPDDSVIRIGYNEANLLERLDANLRGARENSEPVWTPFVTDVDYDAKGQCTLIEYGNGVRTTYAYDRLSFRLTRVLTRRDASAFPDDCPQQPPAGWPGCQVQNLHYTYDPVGNITQLRDDAQQTVFFRNKRVEPSADYIYDAVYRLIEATGREHLGQVGGPPIAHSYNDAGRVGLLSAADGTAMGSYRERYVYDEVGNFASMQHVGTDPASPGWTRGYAYQEPSLLAPAQHSNRLTSTTVGGTTEVYSAGGAGYDAHGNTLSLPHLQVMQWDFRDQLRMTRRQKVNDEDADGVQHQGERTWYVYDGAGQRVRKVTERATGQVKDERVYLGAFEIYRRHGSDPLVRESLHIMDGERRIALVETRTEGSEPKVPPQLIRYQLTNHLGSASVELDDEAQVISYEEYTPYGSTAFQAGRSATEVSLKRYRHTGKERDEETGLYYHSTRYRAPWLGRWVAADPHGLVRGANLFVYARDNPLRNVDPAGTADDDFQGQTPDYGLELMQQVSVQNAVALGMHVPTPAEQSEQRARVAQDARASAAAAKQREAVRAAKGATKQERFEAAKAGVRNSLLDTVKGFMKPLEWTPVGLVEKVTLGAVGLPTPSEAVDQLRAPEPTDDPQNFREWQLRDNYDFTHGGVTFLTTALSFVAPAGISEIAQSGRLALGKLPMLDGVGMGGGGKLIGFSEQWAAKGSAAGGAKATATEVGKVALDNGVRLQQLTSSPIEVLVVDGERVVATPNPKVYAVLKGAGVEESLGVRLLEPRPLKGRLYLVWEGLEPPEWMTVHGGDLLREYLINKYGAGASEAVGETASLPTAICPHCEKLWDMTPGIRQVPK